MYIVHSTTCKRLTYFFLFRREIYSLNFNLDFDVVEIGMDTEGEIAGQGPGGRGPRNHRHRRILV